MIGIQKTEVVEPVDMISVFGHVEGDMRSCAKEVNLGVEPRYTPD